MVKVKSNLLATCLVWIIVTAIGWLAGILNLNSSVETYMDIVRLLPVYLADGLLIGLIVGIGQAFVLRKFTNLTGTWVRATVSGYGLTFLIGLIVSVLIPSIIWLLNGDYLLPLVEPSSASMRINVDDIFWGGFLMGAIQWRALKKIIPNPNPSKGILWMLANWFGLGTSFVVRAFTHRTPLVPFQMGIIGIVVGLVTGLVLLAFLAKFKAAEQDDN